MKTHLDELHEALDNVLQRHGYTLMYVEEKLDNNLAVKYHPGIIVCGHEVISLSVEAIRIKNE